jgi:hypothetical protein
MHAKVITIFKPTGVHDAFTIQNDPNTVFIVNAVFSLEIRPRLL